MVVIAGRGPDSAGWLSLFGQLKFAMRALLHLELLHASSPEPHHFPMGSGTYPYEQLLCHLLPDDGKGYDFNPPKDAFALDVVGNTICADLLDYARRDSVQAGLQLDYDDERIVENMTLLGFHDRQRASRARPRAGRSRFAEGVVSIISASSSSVVQDPFSGWTVRTGIAMFSHKLRVDVPGELLNLLQVRFYVYQRALFHPTKCIAGAMLGAALQFIGWNELPSYLRHVGDAVFLREVRASALIARHVIGYELTDARLEEHLTIDFLDEVIAKLHHPFLPDNCAAAIKIFTDQRECLTNESGETKSSAALDRLAIGDLVRDLDASLELLGRLAARHYFTPVYRILPGTVRVPGVNLSHDELAERFLQAEERWLAEREIEKRAGLPRGSVVIHCPVAKGPRKTANILMVWKDKDGTENARPLRKVNELVPDLFEEHARAVTALEDMYRSMWRLVVSVPPSARLEAIRSAGDGKISHLENVISEVLHEIIIGDGLPTRFKNEFTMRDELKHAARRLSVSTESLPPEESDSGPLFLRDIWRTLVSIEPSLESLRKEMEKQESDPARMRKALIEALRPPEPESTSKHRKRVSQDERSSISIPNTRAQVTSWFKREAKGLAPHVRNEFEKELDEIINLLFNRVEDEVRRREMLSHLHLRLRNEGSILFNNYKQGEIIRILKKEWQLADIDTELFPPSGVKNDSIDFGSIG